MTLILRLVLLAEIILYVLSAVWCRMVITLPWMVSLAAAILVPFALRSALIAITFVIAMREPSAVKRQWNWLRAYALEILSPIAFLSMYGPFEKFLLQDSSPRDHIGDGRPLIILVHGYLSNRGIWWRYAKTLQRRGYYVAAINLSPPLASIDAFVEQLQAAIVHHRQASKSASAILISHSMGGLVCRAWFSKYGDESIQQMITIGSPHNGTQLAPLAFGACAKEMQITSDWHKKLTNEESLLTRQKIMSIRSLQDNVVLPNHSADLMHARNIAFKGVGHLSTVTDNRIRRYVIGLVESGR